MATWGVIDLLGGFDGFYDYLDNQEQLYNTGGIIVVPINNIPTVIPLKN